MKKFYSLWIFLQLCTFGFSQDCSSNVWFKPGAVLEYRTYVSKLAVGRGGDEFVEVTRLTFTVNDVDNSDGSRIYASITKKGNSLKKSFAYEKQIKVACENGKIGFVPGHFLTDTVFNCDIPGPGRGKIAYTRSATGEMIFPFSAAKSVGLIQYVRSSINGDEFEMKSKIRHMELLGEETVSCPAGNYNCSKISISTEAEVDKKWKPIATDFIYYNKEVGIVKWESLTGYFELAKITR